MTTIFQYAVNGVGAGHMMRQMSIARSLKRLAVERGINIDLHCATTSEACKLACREGIPSIKLPSAEAMSGSGLSQEEHRHLGSSMVQHYAQILRPDILVVDCFPDGAFGELGAVAKDIARSAFIFRPSSREYILSRNLYPSMERYDLILVPESEEHAMLDLPANLLHKLRFHGPVMLQNKESALSREAVRKTLGALPEQQIVYLSAGGGGDSQTERILFTLIDALLSLECLIVAGAGSLYRGKVRYGTRIIWIEDAITSALMNGFDAAISAAGYNSFSELLYFGVPTAFFCLPRKADDQMARAESAVRAGAAIALKSFELQDILSAAELLLDVELSLAMRGAARRRVPRNFADDFASDILGML